MQLYTKPFSFVNTTIVKKSVGYADKDNKSGLTKQSTLE